MMKRILRTFSYAAGILGIVGWLGAGLAQTFLANSGEFISIAGAQQYYQPTGTFSNFVNDDAPAINAALQTAAANGGGWVILNSNLPYWANTQITIPAGVTLGCVAPPQKFPQGLHNFTAQGCAIYESLAATPLVNKGSLINARVYSDQYHFVTPPATVHALKNLTACYSGNSSLSNTQGFSCPNSTGNGTGVQNDAFDAIIRDVAIGGFNLGIDEESNSRGVIENVLIEADRCIYYGFIGDYLKENNIECWPFASTDGSQPAASNITATITNVADNGSGAWRVTISAAPSEALAVGDEVYVGGTGPLGIPPGALGRHVIGTVISSTVFDLDTSPGVPSKDAPVVSGTTTSGQPFVQLSAVTNLWPGMTFTGSCFSGTQTVEMLLPGAPGFISSSNATSSGACTLTFTLQTYVSAGTPQLIFDARGGQHYIGFEVQGSGVVANNIFVWAHDTGLQFDQTNGSIGASFANSFNQFSVDSIGTEWRAERTGILFQNGTAQNFVQGYAQNSGGMFAINQANNNTGHDNIVVGGRLAAFALGTVENDSGALVVMNMMGPNATGGSAGAIDYTSNMYNANGATLSVASASRTQGTIFGQAGNLNGVSLDNTSFVTSNLGPVSSLDTVMLGALEVGAYKQNQAVLVGGNTGFPPVIEAIGGDTNIALSLSPKGTGNVTAPALQSVGSPPTLSGTCTTNTQTGGNTSGSFRASCTAGQTVTLTFASVAATGWACDAHDQSTVTNLFNQSGAVSTTSATLTSASATTAELVSFKCMAY